MPRVLRPRQSTGWGMMIVAGAVVLGLAALILMAMWLPGINSLRQVAAQVSDATVAVKAVKPPPPLTAVQQEALERFGRELAGLIKVRDRVKLARLLDTEALAGRVFEKLPEGLAEAGIRTNLLPWLNRNPGVFILEVSGGEAEYLRPTVREGFPAILLRVRRGVESYAEILVRPEGDGFRVVDVFDRMLAWTASDEACYSFANPTAAPDEAALANFPEMPAGASPEMREHLSAVLRAMRSTTVPEVLSLLDGLPPEIKNTPLFFRQRLRCLQRLNTSKTWENARAYKEALRAAPGILGPDCTTDRALADLLRMENDYAGVDECLKRVETAVGGDPHLKFLRANNFLVMKNHDGALALLDEMDRDSTSTKTEKAANLRIMIHLERKNYPALVEALRDFKKNFGVVLARQNYFGGLDRGPEFMASPEFAAWEKENTTGG